MAYFQKGAFFPKRAFHWVALFVHDGVSVVCASWHHFRRPPSAFIGCQSPALWLARGFGRQISNLQVALFPPNSLTIVLPLKCLCCYCDKDTSQRTYEEYSNRFDILEVREYCFNVVFFKIPELLKRILNQKILDVWFRLCHRLRFGFNIAFLLNII